MLEVLQEPPATAGELKSIPRSELTLKLFLQTFKKQHGVGKKPATLIVWQQAIDLCLRYMPAGILLADVTVGHAEQFAAKLKEHGLAKMTIYKRVGFVNQFFRDAVKWKLISENPFEDVKPKKGITKGNVSVSVETIQAVMAQCNPVWKTIVALSRFGGLRCPSEVLSLKWPDVDFEKGRMYIPEPKCEHHDGRGVRECPIFEELRPYLDDAFELRKSEYVVDAQNYRDAAMTERGWANSNLRTQFLKILNRADVKPWRRLFHSMRASRQTELERTFPLHVVCSWLGNSPKVAKESYLLVTDEDFAAASNSVKTSDPPRANKNQLVGEQYKGGAIEPWDYAIANDLGFMEGSVVKYVTRWRNEGGVDDLRKAKDFIEKLIEAHYNSM